MPTPTGETTSSSREDLYVLLVNPFEKLPGERFRDQRYTFLYTTLRRRAHVAWLSSDFHHWSHSRRSVDTLPPEDRPHIRLIRTLPYSRNVSLRRALSYLALSFATIWHLWRLPRRPHVIVCMGPVEQMFLVALYGRLFRVPVVIDVIDTWPDLYLQAFPSALRCLGRFLLAPYFLMSRLTFAWATQVTAVSHTYLAWAMRRGRRTDPENFRCYYLGARAASRAPREESGGMSSMTCLFAGQFGFSYDVELIMDAASRLQALRRHDIRFVLCGDGEKRGYLERRAAELHNVQLLGWLDTDQLKAVAERCQIGLCCYKRSATQSIPTKIFDYLSLGLYILSSLTGEAAQLLREHQVGHTYAAENVDAFVESLLSLVAPAHAHKPSRDTIYRAFDAHFTFDAIYPSMVDDLILPLAREPRLLRR